jgi:hypothetical protein
MAFPMRVPHWLGADPRDTQRKGGAKMEVSTFLASDAALLVFSGLGLVATGLAIVRDIPVQRRVVEEPVTIDR